MDNRISIHVCNRERHSELALLLQSLRTQIYQNWDVVILDENSTPIISNHFLMNLIARIRLEGHGVNIVEGSLKLGVCQARNMLLDKDYFDNPLICRLDDDVIIEPDYLDRLIKVIKEGYDIASGVTPLMGNPSMKRQIKRVMPIINNKEIDKNGNITMMGDDCGGEFIEGKILPAREFRSCALIKKEVFKKLRYETNLSPVGFREEAFLSFRAMWEGFKIGVDTHAKAYHLMTPVGGCRNPNYAEQVNSDHKYFEKWVKEEFKKRGKAPW